MIECEVTQLKPQPAAVVKGQVGFEDLPAFFGGAFTATMTAIEHQGLRATGPPFAYYPAVPTSVVTLEAGFPASGVIEPEGKVVGFELPGGTAVTTVHIGPYNAMEETYTRMQTWMVNHGYDPSPGMWEVYLTDPEREPDSRRWRTRIVWPVRSQGGSPPPNVADPLSVSR